MTKRFTGTSIQHDLIVVSESFKWQLNHRFTCCSCQTWELYESMFGIFLWCEGQKYQDSIAIQEPLQLNCFTWSNTCMVCTFFGSEQVCMWYPLSFQRLSGESQSLWLLQKLVDCSWGPFQYRKGQKQVPSKPQVCPHPNNAPKQYPTLVAREWMKTVAMLKDSDFRDCRYFRV